MDTNTITIPSQLIGFTNTSTDIVTTKAGKKTYLLNGYMEENPEDRICPHCGKPMHKHGNYELKLSHLNIGNVQTMVKVPRARLRCSNPGCRYTKMQEALMKADGHFITQALETYIKDLLEYGFIIKGVSRITGIGENIIKDVDLNRLKDKYTVDGKILRKPDHHTPYLGIDEFKLHDNEYATIIVDLLDGHVLYIAHSKKKQVVYDFISFVGKDFMDDVIAVASDMNANYQAAFEEKCPHIQPIWDLFHIRKHLNEKVIAEIRKDEQKRLKAEGKNEEAALLKKCNHLICSSRKSREEWEAFAAKCELRRKGSKLFNLPDIKSKEGYAKRYQQIIDSNELLFVCDIVKEKLEYAYTLTDELKMTEEIIELLDICEESENKHLIKFAKLIDDHFEGIVAHATFPISSGKVEGINNKIKTLRRQAYGYRDDEYFFLKVIDASYKTYIRNTPSSHKIND